jgi:hypothetical protein
VVSVSNIRYIQADYMESMRQLDELWLLGIRVLEIGVISKLIFIELLWQHSSNLNNSRALRESLAQKLSTDLWSNFKISQRARRSPF